MRRGAGAADYDDVVVNGRVAGLVSLGVSSPPLWSPIEAIQDGRLPIADTTCQVASRVAPTT